MKTPRAMKPRAIVTLRMDADAVAELDRMAKRAEVSRAAMAERLIAEGLENPDVTEVREEARVARAEAVKIRTRLMAAVGREVEALNRELE